MQANRFQRTRVAAAIAGAVLALGAGHAFGAAFAVQTQSGSGLGNAYAGGAAAAEDASTVWSNPAGMARFSTIQIAVAANLIAPSFKFNNDGSLPAANQPLGGNGGNAGNVVGIPAMYVVVPITQQFAFGLGIGVPFGLETEWDNGWLGRYQGIHSKVETINVNPALSWKINDKFSLGAGVSYQHAKLDFTSAQNYGGALAAGCAANPQCAPALGSIAAATYGLDANAKINASDDAWGWNVGMMWNVTPDTRIGAHYRSSIKYSASGDINFDLPTIPKTGNAQIDGILAALAAQAAANPALQNGGVTSNIEVPSTTNVSFFSHVNPKWDIMGDVQYTNWSTIEYLTFTRTTGAVASSTYENFKNVWRVSGGANYYLDDKWKLRGGIAWDQSPVQDAQRTPRLPDADRFWLAGGAQYTYDRNWKFDVGVAYEWVQSGSSDQNAGSTAQYGLIKGNYDVSAWLVGAQVSYAFSPPPQPVKVAEVAPPPPAPVAKPAPPPPPPPAPPPPAPQVQKITLDSKVLFDFDKAVLKPEGKAAIDSQVVGNLAQVQKLDVVLVTGHTDRLGTDAYNQKLSERRADAVRDYLVSKGIDKAKIETIGLGEKQPVVQCDQKNRKELIACLQPNRRVEVQVKGETKK